MDCCKILRYEEFFNHRRKKFWQLSPHMNLFYRNTPIFVQCSSYKQTGVMINSMFLLHITTIVGLNINITDHKSYITYFIFDLIIFGWFVCKIRIIKSSTFLLGFILIWERWFFVNQLCNIFKNTIISCKKLLKSKGLAASRCNGSQGIPSP